MNLNQSLSYKNSSLDAILQKNDRNRQNSSKKAQKCKVDVDCLREVSLEAIPMAHSSILSVYGSVGVVRVNWKDEKGELVSINYGTGFAVTSKIVVTCMHNIFSERTKTLASEILFLPGLDGRISNQQQVLRCSDKARMRCMTPSQSFAYSPLQEQIVMFRLDDHQQVRCSSFLKIGSLEDQDFNKPLSIVGYPSKDYYNATNLREVEAMRVALSGDIHSIQGHVINHRLSTNVGHSGSPIFTKDQSGSYYAVGLHTHRGIRPQFNSGLYFNGEILQTMRDYAQQLSDKKEVNIFRKKYNQMLPKFPYPSSSLIRQVDPNIDNRDSLLELQKFTNTVEKEHAYVVELKLVKQDNEETSNQRREQQSQNSSLIFAYSKKSVFSQFSQVSHPEVSQFIDQQSRVDSYGQISESEVAQVESEAEDLHQASEMSLSYIKPKQQREDFYFQSQGSTFEEGTKSFEDTYISLQSDFEQNMDNYQSCYQQDFCICISIDHQPIRQFQIS